MVAATLAMRWSLSDIWNNAGFLEAASAVSTVILIVGAVKEDWLKLRTIGLLTAKLLVFGSTSFERCVLKKLIAHSIGAILVVVGIVGELVFETRTFIVEDRGTETLSTEVGKAKQAADDAAAAAMLAQGSADAVSKEADVLSDRIKEESAQLNAVSPRAMLLQMSAHSISQRLSQFAGQKVVILNCGDPLRDLERADTWGVLFGLLTNDVGANWKIPDSILTRNWGKCPPQMFGITVFFNDRASAKTKRAAQTLGNSLQTTLPPQRFFPFTVSGSPKLSPPLDEEGPWAPWVFVERNPELICVLVGSRERTPKISPPVSNPRAKP